VAWHTGALREARLRGLDHDLLAEFPNRHDCAWIF
jgi:hypothetical protein